MNQKNSSGSPVDFAGKQLQREVLRTPHAWLCHKARQVDFLHEAIELIRFAPLQLKCFWVITQVPFLFILLGVIYLGTFAPYNPHFVIGIPFLLTPCLLLSRWGILQFARGIRAFIRDESFQLLSKKSVSPPMLTLMILHLMIWIMFLSITGMTCGASPKDQLNYISLLIIGSPGILFINAWLALLTANVIEDYRFSLMTKLFHPFEKIEGTQHGRNRFLNYLSLIMILPFICGMVLFLLFFFSFIIYTIICPIPNIIPFMDFFYQNLYLIFPSALWLLIWLQELFLLPWFCYRVSFRTTVLSGEDFLLRIRRLSQNGAKSVIPLMLLLAVCHGYLSPSAQAQDMPQHEVKSPPVEYHRSMRKPSLWAVSPPPYQQIRYTPYQPQHFRKNIERMDRNNRWIKYFIELAEALGKEIERQYKAFFDALDELLNKLGDLTSKDTQSVQESAASKKPRSKSVLYLFGGLTIIAVLGTILFFTIRSILKAMKKHALDIGGEFDPAQLSTDELLRMEHITADLLPYQEWLLRCEEMERSGNWRLALRAAYLALLARMADYKMIRIHRSRTNQDYIRELIRRHTASDQFLDDFRWHTATFDRCWYGGYPPRKDDVQRIRQTIETIGSQP